jgi:hypothetical protein
VRTGSLGIEVADFDAAVAKAHTAITGLGGYVSGSQMATDGDRRTPRSRTASRPIAGTTPWPPQGAGHEGRQRADPGCRGHTAVVDLDARIENLRVTERSLQAIMAQAVKIPTSSRSSRS